MRASNNTCTNNKHLLSLSSYLLSIIHLIIFYRIMEGEESLRQYSPDLLARDPNISSVVCRLPPTILFHGTADYSIPSDAR